MKLKYIILLLLLVTFISFEYAINKTKKTPLKIALINLSNSKIFALDKSKDYYKKLNRDLKGLGLNITPELFDVITFILVIITMISVVLLSYIYKLNLLVNYEELKAASELLGRPELIKINLGLNVNNILFSTLIMIVLPRLLLKLSVKFKLLLEEKEVIMLQTYALMMIKSGKPVKEILISLNERSRMFKRIFENTINGYSNDPNKALKNARDSTANIGFEKIIRALEQCLNNDRSISLQFLTNHRKLTKELKSLERNKKNTTKNIVSTLLLIIPLLAFMFIFGYPIFSFSLKMLGSMSF